MPTNTHVGGLNCHLVCVTFVSSHVATYLYLWITQLAEREREWESVTQPYDSSKPLTVMVPSSVRHEAHYPPMMLQSIDLDRTVRARVLAANQCKTRQISRSIWHAELTFIHNLMNES